MGLTDQLPTCRSLLSERRPLGGGKSAGEATVPTVACLISANHIIKRTIVRPVIQVSGVRKTYGQTVAVDEVSFEVYDGEIFGLIGPNGAGKTTTMECIEGLRTPDSGTISVLGLN